MKSSKFMGLLILMSLIFLSFRTPIDDESKIVNYTYRSVKFTPNILTNEIRNKINLSIKPVDAQSLDKETYLASLRDGNYEKETLFSNKLLSKSNSSDFLDRQWYDALTCSFSNIDEMTQSGKISPDVASSFKSLLLGETTGFDGSEMISLIENREYYPAIFNPYKLNNSYLSIFQLTFENTSKVVQTISIKDFLINSGDEQYTAYPSSFFEKNGFLSSESIKNLSRYNMPDDLILTPGQKVVKYISIPAISPKLETITIYYLNEGQATEFKFGVSVDFLNKKAELERFEFTDQVRPLFSGEVFYVMEINGLAVPLTENAFYLSKQNYEILFNLHSCALSKKGGIVFFSFSNAEIFETYSLKHFIKLEYIKLDCN